MLVTTRRSRRGVGREIASAEFARLFRILLQGKWPIPSRCRPRNFGLGRLVRRIHHEVLEMDELKRRRLIALVNKDAVQRGEFVLASGARSDYYIDGKQVTLSAEGAALIADLILDVIGGDRADAIGGPTIGADPIAGAVAAASFHRGCSMAAFLVRKGLKDHGTQRWIEGPLRPASRVVLVEDVVTTGGSMLQCLERLAALDCTVVRAVVLVDRLAGAAEAFARHGIPFTALCTTGDLDLAGNR
jgi:orotate phosphoribosyltransferase